MIRILYMSDLHLEMEAWRLAVPGWPAFLARHREIAAHPSRGPMLDKAGSVDLVVMAGDIHNGLRGIVYAEQVSDYFSAPVAYVAGNHEYYRQDMAKLLPAFRASASHSRGRVHFLENETVSFILAGQKLNVLGCTLWTDFELNGHARTAMRYAERRMNDYRQIQIGKAELVPEDTLVRHRESRLWLHKTLAGLRKTEPDARNIIVTHHAPSPKVLGSRTGEIGPAYGSDMLLEFSHLQPAAWIHGHTHYLHDSVAHGIRLVSAPRGYVVYDGSPALEYRPRVLEL